MESLSEGVKLSWKESLHLGRELGPEEGTLKLKGGAELDSRFTLRKGSELEGTL